MTNFIFNVYGVQSKFGFIVLSLSFIWKILIYSDPVGYKNEKCNLRNVEMEILYTRRLDDEDFNKFSKLFDLSK